MLRFCLLVQATGHQNRSFSCFGEEQKQDNKENFRLRSVAHERPCLSSIFSTVPVKNSNASVVLFDIEKLHVFNVFIKADVIFSS